MHRAGAAERNEGEFPRIMPAFDRNDAQRLRHIAVDDFDDARGGLCHRQAQRLGNRNVDRAFRCGNVDRQVAAQQSLAIEIAQYHIRIGHSRRGAAGTVRRGTGIRTRAVRTDL